MFLLITRWVVGQPTPFKTVDGVHLENVVCLSTEREPSGMESTQY